MRIDDQPWRPKSPAQRGETSRRPAQPASECNDIARLGARPGDWRSSLKITERRDSDHQDVAAHDISPDDAGLDQIAFVAQPVGEALRPKRGEIRRRSESDEERGRDRTHGGDVSQVLRSRLSTDVVGGRPVAAEVPPIDEQVRRRDYPAVGSGDDRGVVARPEKCAQTRGQACGDPIDQAELSKVTDTDLSPPGPSCYGVTDIVGHPRIGRAATRAARSTVWQTGNDLEGWRAMVVQAYILIQTEVGKAASVAREISGFRGVTLAEDVTGPYDVIVRAEARNIDEMGRMVVAQVQSVDGITRTLTCPVVHL
jgi:DNA-binding Lrp family transcriptional regulator